MKRNKKKTLATILVVLAALIGNGPLCGAQQPVSKDYIVGAGDRLQIQVWDHNDLNRNVEVSHDGTFSFPFIGKVHAAGSSVYRLEQTLQEKLADGYIVGPQVTVGVAEYQNKKVFLFGEVNRPGSYILKRDMRLLELISEAGGFTDSRGTQCTVIRSSDSVAEARPISLEDASGHDILTINLTQLTEGDTKANIIVAPNDTIYIGAAERIFVTGEVRRPGEIEYKEGMTVRHAISLAGGGTPKAAVSRTLIVRMNQGKEIEIKPELSDAVFPNDVLKVPESYF